MELTSIAILVSTIYSLVTTYYFVDALKRLKSLEERFDSFFSAPYEHDSLSDYPNSAPALKNYTRDTDTLLLG